MQSIAYYSSRIYVMPGLTQYVRYLSGNPLQLFSSQPQGKISNTHLLNTIKIIWTKKILHKI